MQRTTNKFYTNSKQICQTKANSFGSLFDSHFNVSKKFSKTVYVSIEELIIILHAVVSIQF